MPRKPTIDADYVEEGLGSDSGENEDEFEEEQGFEDNGRDSADSKEEDRDSREPRPGTITAAVSSRTGGGADDVDDEEYESSDVGEGEEDSRLAPGRSHAGNGAQTRPVSQQQRTISWTKEMTMKSSLSKRLRKTSDGRTILPDQPLKGPDTLTSRTRNYYEGTKSKLAASLILGAFSLTLFGLCAIAGGKGEALYSTSLAYGDVDASLWYNSTSGNYTTIYSTEVIELAFDGQEYRDLDEELLYTFAQAFGFACFCYLVAVILVIMAAIRISPLLCGATGDYAAITKFDNWEENMYFFGIPTPTFASLQLAKKDEDYLELQPSGNQEGTSSTLETSIVQEEVGDEEAPAFHEH